MTPSRLTRRSFVKGAAAAGAGLALPLGAGEGSGRKTLVAVCEKKESLAGGKPVQQVVDEMVASVVKKVAGKENPDAAWRTIVAGSKDRVLIKFNALFPRATTSPEVILAVVKGLVHAGVSEDRVFIMDNKRGDLKTLGMRSVPGFPKVRCLGAQEDGGFGPEVKVGPVTTRLAKLLTDEADVIINLSRLKHHVLAGMTASLKNHLGSIPRSGARDLHPHLDRIADLNALEPIRTKTRLAVIDALVGIYDRGPRHQPGFTWEAYRLIGGLDPVAVDAVGHDVLLKHRRTLRRYRRLRGLTPPVTYLKRAEEIGLGAADLKKIDVVQV